MIAPCNHCHAVGALSPWRLTLCLLTHSNQGCLWAADDERTGVLPATAAMVVECGPWTGCPDGTECMYALTQRVSHLLEAFMMGSGRAHTVRCHIYYPYGRMWKSILRAATHYPQLSTHFGMRLQLMSTGLTNRLADGDGVILSVHPRGGVGVHSVAPSDCMRHRGLAAQAHLAPGIPALSMVE